jgi:chemotaxis methyl-accepting protein methylase
MHTLAVITDEAENRLINALIGLVVALTWWLRAQPKFRSARRRALRRLRDKRKRKEKASADTDEDHSGQP